MFFSKKVVQILTVVIFVAIISVPSLTMLVTPDKAVSDFENRELAQLDDVQNVDAKAIEEYVNDQLGFRDDIVYSQAYLDVFALKKSPNELVIIGDDHWLYYALPYTAKDFQGVVQYGDADYEYWEGDFQYRRDWLAARGIYYVLVLVPDKKSIYPEYFPPQYPVVHPDNTLLDQFLPIIHARTDIHVVDLRQGLLDHKNNAADNHLLYFETDTHWNTFGAFVGYEQIINELRTYYPELAPLPFASLTYEEIHDSAGGDLALALNLQDEFPQVYPHVSLDESERCATPVLYTSGLGDAQSVQQFLCEDNTVNAIFFHDSFLDYSIGFLAENFRNSVFISRNEFGSYFTPWDWEAEMDQLIADTESNIVIEVIVERQIPRWTPTLEKYQLASE